MAVSSSSATVAVEKATSDLLMGPDWTMNIEICDSINSNYWQPKDVVKAVKKRLQHRSSKVQLLALTLLETMVKNCGDYVHYQIAERNILDEMIKIVRKKADMQVRNKILVLLDSWQEAFGGAGSKHPQYYWAYEELKRSGVVFPKRSLDAAPIFTPPATHPALRSMQAGYGMPSSSSKTLDETMATEIESLSLSSLDSMRSVMDLLSDMLQAVNPSDRMAVKDEVIVDLVDRCRTNQKKLMQMLTTTGDEELLGRGLELNDSIQSLLARHDAIASGAPLPILGASSSSQSTEVPSSVSQTDVKGSGSVESDSTPKASPSALVLSVALSDEEEEDEFAQLARRHSKTQSVTSAESGENSVINSSSPTSHVPESSTTVPSNALALADPPAPVSTSKDQDIIDLLSITLSLEPSPPTTTYAPTDSSQGMHQIPAPPRTEGYSYAPQTYPGNLQYNSYVVPWAQPQSQSESQTQPQQHIYQPQPQSHSQPATPPSKQRYEFEQSLHHQQTQQFQSQPQSQPPLQTQHPQYSPPQQQLHPHHKPRHPQYQSQPQPQPQPQQQFQSQPQPQQPHYQSQPQPQHHYQSQPQPQHYQSQPQPQQQQHYQSQPQSQQQYQAQPQPEQHYQSQPQSQQHLQSHPQPQTQLQLQSQPQHQPQQLHSQPQPIHGQQPQPQQQPQFQNQNIQYPGSYPPPPWAATPGYPNYQNQMSATNLFSAAQVNTTGPLASAPGPRALQHNSSFPPKGLGAPAVGGDPRGQGNPAAAAVGQKPFIPSYRLFEDLNVFGNTDGRVKMTGSSTSTTSSLSGAMGPGMVGGRK